MKFPARAYVYGPLLICAVTLGLWRYFENSPAARDNGKVDGEPLPDAADVASVPDPMVVSAWLASRAKRYRGQLEGWQCDWLVVPVQVEEFGFDHPTRYLMSGDIARAVANKSHCTSDPYLIDRALGEGLRRYKSEEVTQLAKDIGATTILSTYVGHDHQGHMRVTLRLEKRGDGSASFATVSAKSFEDLAYSAELSPFEAFDKRIHRMLDAVGVPTTAPVPVPAGTVPADLPATPQEAVKADTASAVDRAARLTLLGILAPNKESRAGERLFAKALLALGDVADSNDAVQLMRARILFHLKERPYALATLGGAGSPEALALRALVNGDLPTARAALKDVHDPWEFAFLRIEVYDLETAYRREDDTAKDEILGAFGAPWAPLVSARLADDDVWLVPNLIDLKRSLDEIFPIQGQSLSDIVTGNVAIAQLADSSTYDLLAPKHVHAVLGARPRDVGCCVFEPGPTRSDLLDLFDGRIDAALMGRVNFYWSVQGLGQRALGLLGRYDEELAGHPIAEITRAYILYDQFQRGDLSKRDAAKTQMRAAARIAVAADPGQDWPASSGFWYLLQTPAEPYAHALGDAYCEDYPMRPTWNGTPGTLRDRLQFSSDDFEPLQTLITSSHGSERDAFVAELDHRFIGNSDATTLRMREEAHQGDPDPAVVREAIKNDPDNWALYEALSWLYIRQGKYAEASLLALSYPRFSMKTNRTVELSGHAFRIGEGLYYQGAIEAARPLLKIAAGYNNGSASSVLARARLALLDADYTTAVSSFLESAQHYQTLDDFRDYLELLFAGGESDAGWAGFKQLVTMFKGPQPWIAAMIGHRRDGLDEAALHQWLVDASTHSNRPPGDESVVTNALMEEMTDRGPPAEDFPEFIASLAGASRVHSKGTTFWGNLGMDRERRVGPSGFGHERRKPVPADAVVPNRYELFADAYTALRHDHFDASVAAFDRLAAYYDIETTDEWGFALPYFAFAAAQSGDTLGLEQYLRKREDPFPPWGVTLALAVFDGVHGRSAEADKGLDAAFRNRTGTGYWPVSSSYEYAEVCIRLYEITQDERYRERALAWAQAHREIEPAHAWAHALVARFGTHDGASLQALEIALYLDPHSEWAGKTPQKDRDAALEWLKKHRPFRLQDPSASQPTRSM